MKHLLGELIEIGDNKYVVTSVCESKDDNSLPRAKVEMWKLPNKQEPIKDVVQGPMYFRIKELVPTVLKPQCIKYLKEYFKACLIDTRDFVEDALIIKHEGLNKFQIETINRNIEQYGYVMEITEKLDKRITTV